MPRARNAATDRPRKLSWTPVRRGNIYCSPACGSGCTYAGYLDARKRAERMAKQLPGFKPRVWENLGWHYAVTALDAHVSVYPSYDGYHVLASTTHMHAGDPEWGALNARSPKEAISKLKKRLRREITTLQDFLKRLEATGS